MIVRVWEQAIAKWASVVVACGDKEIYDVVKAAGGDAVMTKVDHPSGSDRISEAAEIFDPDHKYKIIINLQGDSPLIDPEVIGKILLPFKDRKVDVATLVSIMTDKDDLTNPSKCKTVVSIKPGDEIGKCIYFSRNPIPYGDGPFYHHLGIYAYRRKALERFVSLPRGWVERQEDLEQLRVLEDGMNMAAVLVDKPSLSVDTPEDLENARKLFLQSNQNML